MNNEKFIKLYDEQLKKCLDACSKEFQYRQDMNICIYRCIELERSDQLKRLEDKIDKIDARTCSRYTYIKHGPGRGLF